MNSAHGRHLTDDELLLRSGRRRGLLRLRAGEGKAPEWLLRPSWSHFKASDVAVLLRFLPWLFSPPWPPPPSFRAAAAPSPTALRRLH